MSNAIGYRICEFQSPAAIYDSSNGWLKVGTGEVCDNERAILIATDTGIGITESGVLSSIYLRPILSPLDESDPDRNHDGISSEQTIALPEQATKLIDDQPNAYENTKADWQKYAFRLRLFIIGFALLMIVIGNTTAGAVLAIPLSLIAVVLLVTWLIKSAKYLPLAFRERRTSVGE